MIPSQRNSYWKGSPGLPFCVWIPFFCLCFTASLSSHAQESAKRDADSAAWMEDVRVKGFETGRERMSVPASVAFIGRRDIARFSNNSLVPALNLVPGVRMEERSPGSYRLSIRGSLLRSPFGVRNVKVYRGDIMLTDAGGNTYLNLLDLNALGGIEILKGPAGSVYGAGTGGVINVLPPDTSLRGDARGRRTTAQLQLTGGGYGQYSGNLNLLTKGERFVWQVSTGRFASEGYRENSRMRRDFLQSDLRWNAGKRHSLTAFLLLADLDYRTPGGLTKSQAAANPRQARPATATLPAAADQKTGIRNRTAFLGFSDRYTVSENWQAVLSITGSRTDFRNPFITNYERRDETNLGLRFKAVHSGSLLGRPLSWVTGVEWQLGSYVIDSTGNRKGEPDGNLARDRVRARQSFLFSQLEWKPDEKLLVHLGVSLNRFGYRLERVVGNPMRGVLNMDFNPQAAPRFALAYHPNKAVTLHFSVSRGFSPPTVAEARPSAGGFATDLQAERGWSYEGGLKSSLFKNRLQLDATAFRFNLRDAIVRRTNNAGAEYFLNAGGTRQKGVELAAQYLAVNRLDGSILRRVRLLGSATFSDFKFDGYVWNGISYHGNRVTGVAPFVGALGADWEFKGGFHFRHTWLYNGEIPLNDANDETAPPTGVWHLRAGRKWQWGKIVLEAFIAADNPFGETYSSGHDINAFGRRYYNPSPLRFWQAGLVVSL